MKLHILNDLHIEFEDFAPPATDADVVILAGDIGVGMAGLSWAKIRFPEQHPVDRLRTVRRSRQVLCHAAGTAADDGFSLIQNHGRRFTPEDAIQLHSASRDWLTAMLAEPFDGKTVVVTHHAPSSQSVHPRYARDLLTPAFASNLENLVEGDRVALWIHGHMHESFDYEIYRTRMVCNPRGYAPKALNEDFDQIYTIEIS